MTVDDAVAGIAATITGQGLKCHPVRDDAVYPKGVTVSDERMKHLQDSIIERAVFHGEWNYAIRPAPRPGAPDPEPAPARPARVPQDILNHPALTGTPAADLTALAAALQAQFEARLQLQYRTRSGPRRTAARSKTPHGGRRLDVTDHLLALRLRRHLNLPLDAIGALLGVSAGTVSRAAALAGQLLAAARITLPGAPPPASLPRTPADLLAHAAANGIPLTIPENGQAMPEHFRPGKSRTPNDTPETDN